MLSGVNSTKINLNELFICNLNEMTKLVYFLLKWPILSGYPNKWGSLELLDQLNKLIGFLETALRTNSSTINEYINLLLF